MGGATWIEEFAGWLSYDKLDFNQAMLEAKRDDSRVCANFTMSLSDPEAHRLDGQITAGWVDWDGLDGRMVVERGKFEFFRPARRGWDLLHLRMRYWVHLRTADGYELTLVGFKLIENDPGYDSWTDATTLFTRILRGSHEPQPDRSGGALTGQDLPADIDDLLATGVLTISPMSFGKQLFTFKGSDGTRGLKSREVRAYQARFLRDLARAYVGRRVREGRPSFPTDHPELPWDALADTDWHAVTDKPRLLRRIFPYTVEDLDFPLNVQQLRVDRKSGSREEARRGPVLLIPGSGVRAEMVYGQPVGTSIAECLLGEGYDVWVQSWRASIDFPPTSYTLDQAARMDHPAAVRRVLEATGCGQLRAVVHCQGSVSFVMAAVAGFLRDGDQDMVSHVVSSAVSLFPEVTFPTWVKQRVTLPTLGRLLPWADAQWGIRPQTPTGGGFAVAAKGLERPCGNAPCELANFMYGSGWDVLLRHLDDDETPHVAPEVHEWSSRELGFTPLSLIKQVAESSRYGHIVPAEPRDWRTPVSYVANQPQTRAKFTFIAGDHNRMFRWQGQRRASEFFNQFHDDDHPQADFVPLPGYGHLDTFWGKNAPRDVFPHIVRGLAWDGDPGEQPSKDPTASTEGREAWLPREGVIANRIRGKGGGRRLTTTLSVGVDQTGALGFTASALTAEAGQVTIHFTNGTQDPHNLTVQEGASGPVLGVTPTFTDGTETLRLTLKPGTYTFYCNGARHRDEGMQGTLTVE